METNTAGKQETYYGWQVNFFLWPKESPKSLCSVTSLPASCWNSVGNKELHDFKIYIHRTSLMVQWLRIHLPMQGTQVWSLVWKDSTCLGATKPMCHNYWASALETVSCNYQAHTPQLLKPVWSKAQKPEHWAHIFRLLSLCAYSLCSATREATTTRSL